MLSLSIRYKEAVSPIIHCAPKSSSHHFICHQNVHLLTDIYNPCSIQGKRLFSGLKKTFFSQPSIHIVDYLGTFAGIPSNFTLSCKRPIELIASPELNRNKGAVETIPLTTLSFSLLFLTHTKTECKYYLFVASCKKKSCSMCDLSLLVFVFRCTYTLLFYFDFTVPVTDFLHVSASLRLSSSFSRNRGCMSSDV